jgi:hypothetical protein
MRNTEKLRPVTSVSRASVGALYEDRRHPLQGEVFITMRDAQTGVIQEKRHQKNQIVLDASILVARLLKNNVDPPFGTYVLAVGTGASGWDPMNPPAATNTQRALYSELTRKTFSLTQFINGSGSPVSYPTNVFDYTCTFAESEAVGPLVEMGIIGGNISTNLAVRNPVSPPNGSYDPTVDLTQFETLINFLSYKVINKPPTSTLTITWRITT